MTLAALLEYARGLRGTPVAQIEIGEVHTLAQGVIDLLSVLPPCGLEPPQIVAFDDGSHGVLVDDRGDPLDVEETRGYAAMVLRSADKAEELSK